MKIFAAALATALLTAGPTPAAERTITLKVDNMTCPTCGPTVKKALSRVSGASRIDVAVDAGLATVTFDDAKTTVEALVAATTNAGYPARLAKESTQ